MKPLSQRLGNILIDTMVDHEDEVRAALREDRRPVSGLDDVCEALRGIVARRQRESFGLPPEPMRRHEKLVRDRIPERIRANGEPCALDQHYRKAEPEEMRELLVAKLREEISEFEAKPSGEELVDIFEAFIALALTENLDLRIIQHDAEEKRYERGGFDQRFVLFLPQNKT